MNIIRAVGRLVRAVTPLVVLFAATVGIPFGLWHFFGAPLPDHVPDYIQIKAWLDQTTVFPTQTAVQILVIATWGFWAVFVVQIIVQFPRVAVETVKALRSRAPLPTAAHANLAGRLLTSVAISIIATRGTISAASAATSVTAPTPAAPGTVATSASTGAATHTVTRGECLWDIAAHHLGDATRWKEIYKLNAHRVQVDGQVLTDPNRVLPGWILALPASASPTTTSATHSPPPSPSPGESLLPIQIAAPDVIPRQQAATPPSSPSAATAPRASEPTGAPSVVRRPVAVHLPTGGYVSLTLGAGLVAAMAAASVRSRANARRRDPGQPRPVVESLGELESALFRAASTIGHGRVDDTDPYVDTPAGTSQLPRGLSALRAPIAVYIGNRHGRPIPLCTATAGGLGLLGDGAHDVVRAVLVSALSAGGFLAGEAVYSVFTTTADLYTLTGHRLSGRVLDRLTVCETTGDTLAALRRVDATARPLLIAAAGFGAIAEADLSDVDVVLLGGDGAGTIATIDEHGAVVATGATATELDHADAYRLSLEEARTLFGRLLAAAPPQANSKDAESSISEASYPPAEPEPVEAPQATVPDPFPTAVVPPVPRPASDAAPAAPEATLAVNILGPLQVQMAGRDVTEHFRPLTAAVLLQLALNPRGISRTALAADLWPEPTLDPDTRAKRFKATLSHTRLALAQAYGEKADHILEARPSRLLILNPALIAVDAWRFDQLLTGADSRTGRSTSERVSALLEAIGLHRGQIAHGHEHAGDRDDDQTWLAPHREAYFHKLVDAHAEAAALLRGVDPDHAIAILERAADLEPWNNALSEQIIEIHVENGQHHAAARRLAVLTEHLALLGMHPGPRLKALMDSALVG